MDNLKDRMLFAAVFLLWCALVYISYNYLNGFIFHLLHVPLLYRYWKDFVATRPETPTENSNPEPQTESNKRRKGDITPTESTVDNGSVSGTPPFKKIRVPSPKRKSTTEFATKPDLNFGVTVKGSFTWQHDQVIKELKQKMELNSNKPEDSSDIQIDVSAEGPATSTGLGSTSNRLPKCGNPSTLSDTAEKDAKLSEMPIYTRWRSSGPNPKSILKVRESDKKPLPLNSDADQETEVPKEFERSYSFPLRQKRFEGWVETQRKTVEDDLLTNFKNLHLLNADHLGNRRRIASGPEPRSQNKAIELSDLTCSVEIRRSESVKESRKQPESKKFRISNLFSRNKKPHSAPASTSNSSSKLFSFFPSKRRASSMYSIVPNDDNNLRGSIESRLYTAGDPSPFTGSTNNGLERHRNADVLYSSWDGGNSVQYNS